VETGVDRDPIDLLHVEQLVDHAQARFLGVVVDAVEAGQEGVALLPQAGQQVDDVRRGNATRAARWKLV
jgi:hypothetical protein